MGRLKIPSFKFQGFKVNSRKRDVIKRVIDGENITKYTLYVYYFENIYIVHYSIQVPIIE